MSNCSDQVPARGNVRADSVVAGQQYPIWVKEYGARLISEWLSVRREYVMARVRALRGQVPKECRKNRSRFASFVRVIEPMFHGMRRESA